MNDKVKSDKLLYLQAETFDAATLAERLECLILDFAYRYFDKAAPDEEFKYEALYHYDVMQAHIFNLCDLARDVFKILQSIQERECEAQQ